jgi:hypothetical protein
MTRTALERLLVGLTVVVCLLAGTARAATPQRRSSKQRIRFARGTHSETLFSSNLFFFSLDADRAPQLKASVAR